MINKCIDKIKNKFKFQECYRANSRIIGTVSLFSFIDSIIRRKSSILILGIYYTKHDQAPIL